MAIGRTNAGGAGGAALNFKVVAGLTQPGSATENTIWVKTEKIGYWYFSATQPNEMQEWDVWFPMGVSSSLEFNALKKNGIQLYPASAKQYLSGALISVAAMIYQGGEWLAWITHIIKGGVIGEYGFHSITDGYSNPAKLTQYDGYLYLETSKSGFEGMAGTVNAIDLTGKTKVTAVIDVVQIGYAGDRYYPALVVASSAKLNATSHLGIARTSKTGLQTIEVIVNDVNQTCWIGVRCNALGDNSYTKIKIYDIYVE